VRKPLLISTSSPPRRSSLTDHSAERAPQPRCLTDSANRASIRLAFAAQTPIQD
jgi:hypothetical protein